MHCLRCTTFCSAHMSPKNPENHFLRFPTSCSARRSLRIPESPFLRFPTFCSARRSPRIPESPFFENKFCPRQRSCLGQVACSKQKSDFEKQFYPRQRSCLGQVPCSRKIRFLRESSPPGSEAARDKWLVKKNIF